MKAKDALDMKGRLHIKLYARSGEIVQTVSEKNAIVIDGRDLVAKMFIGEEIDPISHIGVGSSGDPVDPGADSALKAEVLRKSILKTEIVEIEEAADPNTPNATVKRKRVTVSTDLDFNEGNDAPLNEAGLFNAETGGIMYNRVVFPTINKTLEFKLTLVWEIIF